MRNFYYLFLALTLCWFCPNGLKAQSITANFNSSPSADCALPAGCTSFTTNVSGTTFVFTLVSSDPGGSFQYLPAGGGVNASGSMDILSGTLPNTATIEKVIIARQDGFGFRFNSIYIQNNLAQTTVVQGYSNNQPVGSSQSVVKGAVSTLTFGGIAVDKVELTSTDFFYITFDDFSACVPPVPSFTVSSACVSSATQFTDASTAVATEATYAWDFTNDGSTDNTTKGNVSFTYPAAGNYTAKLTITQGDCSDSYTTTVNVQEITATPAITSTLCPSVTTVSGTSAEANGTVVKVFVNNVETGSGGVVQNGTWHATIPALSTGNIVTAKALATGKCISASTEAITVGSSTATTTSVTSSKNPSFTAAPDNSVNFTATVTSGGSPVTTGSVTFKEGAAILSANVALNASGQASFITSFSMEGSHVIQAIFNNVCPFATSNGSITQIVNNHTTVNGNTFCNDRSPITINDNATATPYPSYIFVSGLGDQIQSLSVSIQGFSHMLTSNVDVLLVGPQGGNLVLMSNAGNSAVSGINLTFNDAAASQLPQFAALTSGTFKPTAFTPSASFPAPAPAGPNYAAPLGSSTLGLFSNTDPNGTWSLYVVDHASGNIGSIAGWCLTITTQPTCRITCPTVAPVSNAPGQCGAHVTFANATTTGDCGPLSYTANRQPVASGDFFPVGTTVVTVSSASSGQSCQFTVTVNDTEDPQFTTCPAGGDLGINPPSIPAPGGAVATDNCGTPVIVPTIEAVQVNGCQRSRTTVYVATDASGRTATCYQTFTWIEDHAGPNLTCPMNIEESNTLGTCGRIVSFSASANDDCGSAVTVAYFIGTTEITSPHTFPVGTTTVNVTATDAAGNSNNCSFTVTINDTEAPVITNCPLDKNANTTLNQCTAIVSFAAMASDNCPGVQVKYYIGPTEIASPYVFEKGETTVTVKAIDGAGNLNATPCTFKVTVTDNQDPSITAPPPINRSTSTSTCTAYVSNTDLGTPVVDDNCPDVTYQRSGVPMGNLFPVGVTTITYTAMDAGGRTKTATQTVTVTDNTKPTFTTNLSASPLVLWPPDHKLKEIVLSYVTSDNCGVVTNNITVTSTDPISGVSDGDQTPDWIVVNDHLVQLRAERGKGKDARIYTITVTPVDASGNTGTPQSVNIYVAHNITAPITGTPFKVGSTVSFSGVFWDVPGSRHTANWSIDGSTSVKASVTEPSGSKNGKVTGSYKFTTAGVYKLRMNVVDQNKVTSYTDMNEDMEAIVVIYDPNGGYTYGGGYFNSPAGALKSDPLATGKANFGYTVNYYKNATLPKGETQFEFKVGSFEYNALNFDYLSVAGYKAVFKGSGKIIGGQSGISFMMFVVDGALDGSGVDKVRLKIFNKNTNEVYYDSEPGTSDAANPKTPVGDGSTVVIGGSGAAPLTVAVPSEKVPQKEVEPLQVQALPNPSTHHFILQLSGGTTEPVNLRMVDALGRVIEARSRIASNSTLQVGGTYRPGIYFVEAVQGRQRVVLKLIKQPD